MHAPNDQSTPERATQSDRAREVLARKLIADGIQQADREHRPIDTDTARILAAAVHDGPRSPLARFAVTGRMRRSAIQQELQRAADALAALEPGDSQAASPNEQRIWLDALRAYITGTTRSPRRPARPHSARSSRTTEPAES